VRACFDALAHVAKVLVGVSCGLVSSWVRSVEMRVMGL
jgi:hypothetical protein